MTLPSRLALQFSRELREALTATQMKIVLERNAAEEHPDICHSHDFLDANMIMASAFEKVHGHFVDPTIEGDCEKWNAAWKEAKANQFKTGRA
jgi:hypothetical protein